jgi:TPR repeat protein
MSSHAYVVALAAWFAIGACDASPAQSPREPAPIAAPEPAAKPAPAPEPEPAAPQDGACANAESCFDAASEAERAREPKRAAPLYQRACELGIGQACHRLGVMHQEGTGVARDEDKARELFGVGCRQDSAAACDALGH